MEMLVHKLNCMAELKMAVPRLTVNSCAVSKDVELLLILCADHNPLGSVVQFVIHLTVCLPASISPSSDEDDVGDSQKS